MSSKSEPVFGLYRRIAIGHRDKNRKPGGLVVSTNAPSAKEVIVAGTFNEWNPKSLSLKRTGDGHWVRTLDLPPGRYEYKFIIDGEWCCEQGCDKSFDGCPGCVANQFGTMNRVLVVEGIAPKSRRSHQLA